MMRPCRSALLAIVVATGIGSPLAAEAGAEPGDGDTWAERASLAQESFHANFWNERRSMFDSRHPRPRSRDWHYWWQAHAMDVLIDAYERAEDDRYLDQAGQLYRGVVERNGGITIDFYDDMLWMALALLRLHDHTGDDTYRDAVKFLWQDIQTGWNDEQGGGIAWQKGQLDYKNTPSNAPAVILAARLHQRFGDEDDLAWAMNIYDWLQETLIDPETGFAWDGINRRGNGRIDRRWAFTYNQGTYIGASLELYRITGDEAYRREAFRTAEASMDRLVGDDRIFRERGRGDGGHFKGILVRYMADLILEFPDETEAYAELLLHNAETLWQRTVEGDELLFAADWSRTGEAPVELSVQLSGMMLIEHVARLQE